MSSAYLLFVVEIIMILIILLAVVLPLSITFWVTSWFLSSVHDSYEPISPTRWLIAILLPVLISAWGMKKKSLDISGGVTALFVGFVLSLSNYCFMASMICFFLIASKATKYRSHRKQKFEDSFKDGGQRNWIQVLCNGGVATELSLIYMIDRGCKETIIDFVGDYRGSWLCMSVLGAIACSCGDTLASELGATIGGGLPYLIITGKRVPRGTNGGVSPLGLFFSILGGLFIGLTYYCVLLLCFNPSALVDSSPQWPVIFVSAFAGLVGSVIDSLLGATLQYSGVDMKTGRIVEHPGEDIRHISGTGILDNHSVNLLSSVLTALITPNIAMTFWQWI